MRIVAFDIETASAEELHSFGPDFVRLCGWADLADGRVQISTDPEELINALAAADGITAHNGLNFDLMALAKWNGADYEALALKTFDTLLAERHLNPVAAKGAQPNGYYKLEATARRYGVDGKSVVDFEGKREILRRLKGDKYADRMKPGKGDSFGVLDLLATHYGGYDKIAQDDPDYVCYLIADVRAQVGVFTRQQALVAQLPRTGPGSQAYLRREHYTTASTARVTLEGMRSNVDLTMKRWSEGQARLEASKQMLAERYGMPTEGKKPHTTNPGKAALRAAMLASLRCTEQQLDRNWPLNSDGSLSTAKDTLNVMIERFAVIRPEAAELCRTILAMNGERTIYGTVLDHLVGDRVHPYIGADQSSGRWSMMKPGLTVFGKRGGKARERAIMVADEDDVLVAIDADQIDARMIAAMSQDPEYMKLFRPGVDLHSEVAFRVWPDMGKHGSTCHLVPDPRGRNICDCGVVRKCHCDYRDKAKVFGHGWNYGMGPGSMARNHGVDISVAQQFDRGMQEAFPVLCRWKDEMRQAAGVLGYNEEAPSNDSYRILHTIFGRPVRVERNRAYTQACAQLGQGSTRDGMAEAILKLSPYYRRRIRAIIHDEIVVSIPDGPDAQERAQTLADSMGYEVQGVSITFGCSRVAKSWAGCYGEQYES